MNQKYRFNKPRDERPHYFSWRVRINTKGIIESKQVTRRNLNPNDTTVTHYCVLQMTTARGLRTGDDFSASPPMSTETASYIANTQPMPTTPGSHAHTSQAIPTKGDEKRLHTPLDSPAIKINDPHTRDNTISNKASQPQN